MDWKLPCEGECRCGRVKIRVTKPPLLTMACHCTVGQRFAVQAWMPGSARPSLRSAACPSMTNCISRLG